MKLLIKIGKTIGCFAAYIVCILGAACWMNLLVGVWDNYNSEE